MTPAEFVNSLTATGTMRSSYQIWRHWPHEQGTSRCRAARSDCGCPDRLLDVGYIKRGQLVRCVFDAGHGQCSEQHCRGLFALAPMVPTLRSASLTSRPHVSQWVTSLAGTGLTWNYVSQLVAPGQPGIVDQETMQQACDLTDTTGEELYVLDAGGQMYGNSICSQEERNGWAPESSPGPLAAQAQQQASADAVRHRPPQHSSRPRRPRRCFVCGTGVGVIPGIG